LEEVVASEFGVVMIEFCHSAVIIARPANLE
jgi:hypothetical protein